MEIHPNSWSDYKLITMEILMGENTRKGPNYWKMNNEILEEKSIGKKLKNLYSFRKLKKKTLQT